MNRSIIIAVLSIIIILLVFSDYGKVGVVYDCTVAETRSDYPIEIKNECRRLFKEYNDKEYLLQT